MGKKIELKCNVATFKSGDTVEIGNGEDQLAKKVFDTLDDHHFVEVKDKSLANTKELQSELDDATARANDLDLKNTGLTTKVGELETANTGLTTKVGELEAEKIDLTTKADELADGIKGIDLTQNADKLKAAVKKLQEGV